MPAKSPPGIKVEIPVELKRALKANPAALARFERMPPSHQREYAGYVSEAKQAETRERRAAKTILMLDRPPQRQR